MRVGDLGGSLDQRRYRPGFRAWIRAAEIELIVAFDGTVALRFRPAPSQHLGLAAERSAMRVQLSGTLFRIPARMRLLRRSPRNQRLGLIQ